MATNNWPDVTLKKINFVIQQRGASINYINDRAIGLICEDMKLCEIDRFGRVDWGGSGMKLNDTVEVANG